MILHVAAQCDLGCQRTNNEDMILVGDQTLRNAFLSTTLAAASPGAPMVIAVADGMGGAAAGERASEHAMEQLAGTLRRAPADLDGCELDELLDIWARSTHAQLLEMGRQNPSLAGMGTTAVGLLVHRGHAWRFHVGDSRLYRWRNGVLQQLTADHSARRAWSDNSQPSNLLVNSIGGANESWLDCEPIDGGLQPGDRFLLSSDGLHDVVDAVHIERALAADRETAVRMLIHLARDAGGPDNISAILVDVASARLDRVPHSF